MAKQSPNRILHSPMLVLFTIRLAMMIWSFSGLEGTASALDSSRISEGSDGGTASALFPFDDDDKLTFSAQGDGLFKDDSTGSLWNIFGQAISGPLKGETMTPLKAANHFWFDWVTFIPET